MYGTGRWEWRHVRRDGREVTTDEIVDWWVKVRVAVERTKVVWLGKCERVQRRELVTGWAVSAWVGLE